MPLHAAPTAYERTMRDSLVGIVDRSLQLDAIVAASVQPVGEIVARQPAPPAQPQIGADDGPRDEDRDEHRREPGKGDDLPPEDGLVLVLDAVVEAPVPLVEQHFQPDAACGNVADAHLAFCFRTWIDLEDARIKGERDPVAAARWRALALVRLR